MNEALHGETTAKLFTKIAPWVIAFASLATLLYHVSVASTTLQMEVADHERRITKIETVIDSQQQLLYQISSKLSTVNQRLIDRWGASGTPQNSSK